MGRQKLFVAIFGIVLLALVGAALFLVLGDPAAPETPDARAPVATDDDPATTTKTPEKRRHAGQQGHASVIGRLVRGKDRVPVAGETVRLDREGLPGWSVLTDDTGRFRFERLPHGGPFTVSATVADCAPVSRPGLALDRREELDVGDLRLDRAVSVTIVVKTLADAPVEGALVEAFAQAEVDWTGDWTKRLAQIGVAPVAVASLRTDAAGEARFDALATGRWGFRASAEGYSRRGRSSMMLEPEDDADREPVVIRLWPGHSLSGRVVDQDDAPVPEAQILAMKPNQAWSPLAAPLFHRTTADGEGRYALDALPSGELAILAARPGGVPAQVAVLRIPDLDAFDVRLRLGGTLQGTVTEKESGEPVPDVEVRATGWAASSQRVGVAVTDAEGRYVIDEMLEGIVNQVTVDRPGWVVVHESANPWQQIMLQRGSTATHDIAIRKGAIVTGVVRGPDGPLAGAAIVIHATNAQGWSSKSAKTDATGRYRVEGLTEGKGLLQITAEGHTQLGFPAQWWEALNNRTLPEEWALEIPADGEVVKDATLVVGGAAEGVVRGADDEPMPGAQVRVWTNGGNVQAETDGEGVFRLEGLPFGVDVRLNVSAEGHVSATQPIQVRKSEPLTGIEITLQRRATVRGTVTTPEGDPPPDGAYVRISQPQSLDSSQPYNWQDPERRWDALEAHPVKPDGTYEIALPWGSGKFVVRASADGSVATESEAVEIREGLAEYEVNVELGRGHVLRGRAVDAETSAAIAGALVALGTRHPQADTQPWMTQNVFPPLRAVTDAEGRFSVAFSREAKVDLRVRHDGYVEAKQAPKLPHDGELEVRLAPALRIAGVVRYPDGTPVAGAQVSYTNNKPQPVYANQTIITGDDGAFEIRDLPKGAYTVTIQPPWNGGVNIKQESVQSVQAGTTDLEITVAAGLSIGGRVLGPDGEGVPNTWVNAQPESNQTGGAWRGTSTKTDGTFSIVGLDEGTFTLHVSGTGGAQTVQEKGVAAGTQGLTIRLQQGLEIRGEIVDEEGAPVSGETVYAVRIVEGGERQLGGQSMVQTAADGAFVITGLAPGDYVIHRNPGGGDAKRRNHALLGGGRVAAGSTGVRLVLSPGVAISGVIVRADGASVEGASRMWVRVRVAGQQGDKWANVDDKGSFRMEGLSPDVDYELRTMGGGFRPGTAGPFPGGTEGVRILVEPGLSCSGRLIDQNGDGVSGTNVTFRSDSSDDYSWASTDDDGGFEVTGLGDGEYSATAWIQTTVDGNTQQRQVDLGSVTAGTSGLTLEVPPQE